MLFWKPCLQLTVAIYSPNKMHSLCGIQSRVTSCRKGVLFIHSGSNEVVYQYVDLHTFCQNPSSLNSRFSLKTSCFSSLSPGWESVETGQSNNCFIALYIWALTQGKVQGWSHPYFYYCHKFCIYRTELILAVTPEVASPCVDLSPPLPLQQASPGLWRASACGRAAPAWTPPASWSPGASLWRRCRRTSWQTFCHIQSPSWYFSEKERYTFKHMIKE